MFASLLEQKRCFLGKKPPGAKKAVFSTHAGCYRWIVLQGTLLMMTLISVSDNTFR
jgi:hypothetical protein